jgi:tetratricopeptide (TPR) repeat protein
LELLWLLAVFLVPLVFLGRDHLISESELAFVDLPKVALLRTLAALTAVFWLVEWSLTGRRGNTATPGLAQWPAIANQTFHQLRAKLLAQPSRWVIAAAAVFLASTLLSAVLSTSFNVSVWGLIPGQDTYPAYTVLSHFLFFAAVATHLNTRAQLARLLGAMISMGTLVSALAVAQHFGIDPFNLLDPIDPTQATSTLGNAIVAGSVLVLTIPLTLMAALVTMRKPGIGGAFWWRFAGWILVLCIELLGLVFTFSRGPWISAIAALVAVLSLILLFTGWRNWVKGMLVVGTAGGLCFLVVSVTQDVSIEHRLDGQAAAGSSEIIDPSQVIAQAAGGRDVAERFASLDATARDGGGLSGRFEIWRASQRLILQRTWFEFDDLSLPLLRPVFGYGPDMFKYTYLLERRPQPNTGQLISERFAHNYFIHKGVELGALGLLSSLGLFLVPLGVGGYLLVRRGGNYSSTHRLILVGLLATLAARFMEQMAGVASISDLAVTWALFGVFAALPAIMGENPAAPAQDQADTTDQSIPSRRSRPTNRDPVKETMGAGRIWRPAVAAVLIAGIGGLTWIKTIEYPLAAVEAREGVQQITNGQYPSAVASLQNAVSMAPGVFVYSTLQASIYVAYGAGSTANGTGATGREAECDVTNDDLAYRTCLAHKARSYHRQAARQRPMDWRPRLALAESTMTLASLERDVQLAGEATVLFQQVAQMDPQAWWRWTALARAYNQEGKPEQALEALERSFTILGGSDEAAYSWLLHGIVRRDLEQPGEALDAFGRAISLFHILEDSPKQRFPDYRLAVLNGMADAYSNRGAVLTDVGEYQEAIADLGQAIMLNPSLATAYINRANAYANLDLLQNSLDDYHEAIRLNSNMALAYYNRALAYTYLNEDQLAQLDVDRVAKLGLDTAVLLERIEQAKKNR